MKRLLVVVVFVIAAAGAVTFYRKAEQGARELAAEQEQDLERSAKRRSALRAIEIKAAEDLARTLESVEQTRFESDLKTTRDRRAAELLHETKLANIKAERAAAIEKAKRDYP